MISFIYEKKYFGDRVPLRIEKDINSSVKDIVSSDQVRKKCEM